MIKTFIGVLLILKPSYATNSTQIHGRKNFLRDAVAGATPRIIGGDKVTNGTFRYPWYTRVSGCGGQLVSPEFVLTAAHCIDVNCRLEDNGVKVCDWKKHMEVHVGLLCERQGEDERNCGQVRFCVHKYIV